MLDHKGKIRKIWSNLHKRARPREGLARTPTRRPRQCPGSQKEDKLFYLSLPDLNKPMLDSGKFEPLFFVFYKVFW